jgi:hypothetical protein
VPIEIGPSRRLRARRRPPPTQGTLFGRRRLTAGRRLLCRLKSAFNGAPRQASASADAGNAFRSAQADRRPKAFVPIEIGLQRRSAPGVGLRRRRERFSVGAGRPSAEGLSRPNSFGAQADRWPKAFGRLKSAFNGAARQASASADAGNAFRSAQADRRPKAPGGRIHSARRPTVGRRLLCRLKSAPQGAARQASASADAKPPPGRRRPTVGRRLLCRLKSAPQGAPRQASASADAGNAFRSAQADRWPKAFVPIEIGLQRRSAPGVGLRRRRERFSVGAGRPSAEGLSRPNSFGTQADRRPKAFVPIEIGPSRRLRARRRPPPTQRTPSRSAQADRRPKAPRGRIHSAHRPTVGRRPPEVEFIRPHGIAKTRGLRLK